MTNNIQQEHITHKGIVYSIAKHNNGDNVSIFVHKTNLSHGYLLAVMDNKFQPISSYAENVKIKNIFGDNIHQLKTFIKELAMMCRSRFMPIIYFEKIIELSKDVSRYYGTTYLDFIDSYDPVEIVGLYNIVSGSKLVSNPDTFLVENMIYWPIYYSLITLNNQETSDDKSCRIFASCVYIEEATEDIMNLVSNLFVKLSVRPNQKMLKPLLKSNGELKQIIAS